MAELSQIKELLKNELTPIHAKLVMLEENFKQLTASYEYLSAKHDQLLEQSKGTSEKIIGLIKSTKTMQSEINSSKDMALKTMTDTEELAHYLQRDCLEISGVKPNAEYSSENIVENIGKVLNVNVTEKDISVAHPLPSFLGAKSKTFAGGVGLYVSENINFKRINDLDLGLFEGLENCWIEIERKKQKNVVIGCIYRHLSQNRACFYQAIKSKLEMLNNEGCEVYITGDINMDFFRYNTDNQTSEYLDMLLSLGYLPIITKPTRITDHSATLIYHIYTNVPQKVVKSGVCLAGITDHLPIFCTVDNKFPTYNGLRYFKDFSKFKDELFINDLNNLNFNNLVSSDVNQSMNNIHKALTKITDKYAPLKKISNSRKRLLKKPWISKCLLVSIKMRHKLFKSHFLSKDPDKIKQYKIYNNKLNKLKEQAKKNYFTAQI